MRRGCVFTITILSAIVLVLSVLFYLFVWPERKVLGTSSFAAALEYALGEYKKDQGVYPETNDNAKVMEALYGANPRKKVYLKGLESVMRDGEITDFWKVPLRFEIPPAGSDEKPKVYSAGPNKTFGDEDDITSEPYKIDMEKKNAK